MNRAAIFGSVIAAAAAMGFVVQHALLNPSAKPTTQSSPALAVTSLPERLPEFSLTNRDGQPQSINSWPGKSLIINFWATWCAPCKKEIPLLQSIAKDRAGEGFQVVGIAVDFRDDVLKYADRMKIDYPLLIGEQDGLAAINAFGQDAVGFPFTVFTDAQGRIVTAHLGELHADEAKVILDTVRDVNAGKLPIVQARKQLKS